MKKGKTYRVTARKLPREPYTTHASLVAMCIEVWMVAFLPPVSCVLHGDIGGRV